MTPTTCIRPGGAVVFWTLSEFTDRDRLADGLADAGFGDLVPEPRPLAACLKAALQQTLAGPTRIVRPLQGRDGFSLVEERRGRRANAYHQTLAVTVEGEGPSASLDFHPHDGRADAVRSAFALRRGLLACHQVTDCLVRIVGRLDGTSLRPGGGMYWLAEHRLPAWEQAAAGGRRRRPTAGRTPATCCGWRWTPTPCGPSATRSAPRSWPTPRGSGTRCWRAGWGAGPGDPAAAGAGAAGEGAAVRGAAGHRAGPAAGGGGRRRARRRGRRPAGRAAGRRSHCGVRRLNLPPPGFPSRGRRPAAAPGPSPFLQESSHERPEPVRRAGGGGPPAGRRGARPAGRARAARKRLVLARDARSAFFAALALR